MLNKRAWKVVVDPSSGAVENNNAQISMIKSVMGNMDPASPAYSAMSEKIAVLMGVQIPKQSAPQATPGAAPTAALPAGGGAPGPAPTPGPVGAGAPIPMGS